MRVIKILLLIAVLTTVVSFVSAKAYNDTNAYVFDLSVPLFGGNIRPLPRLKQEDAQTQKIKEISIAPKKDKLKVRVEKSDGDVNGNYSAVTKWITIQNGNDIEFTDPATYMLASNRWFSIRIRSEFYYTAPTRVSGRWYVN